MNTKSISALSGVCLGLLVAAAATAAELHVPADYPTIQSAVNAAQDNDTIRLAPGVYAGQVLLVRKKLTLVGTPGAVLRATQDMPQSLTPYDFCSTPLLGLALSEVTIRGIRFEGEHVADGYPCRMAGIIFSGSSGVVEECLFSGFRGETDLSGFGVTAANNTTLGTGPVQVQIRRCTFSDNGCSIFVRGADAAPAQQRLTFAIENNIIAGLRPTSISSQTGIHVSYGATGTVRGNTITDHAFIGQGAARGIMAADFFWLYFGKTNPAAVLPVTYAGNTFRNNQQHLVTLFDKGSQIVGNTFEATSAGNRAVGVAVSGRNLLIATNSFSDIPTGVILLGDDPDYPKGAVGIATDSALINNRFCSVADPIVAEALTTNITQQGMITCPFAPPTLAIASAVLLSWPDDGLNHTLESALDSLGPWSPMNALPTVQDGQVTFAVATDGQHRFFRLR